MLQRHLCLQINSTKFKSKERPLRSVSKFTDDFGFSLPYRLFENTQISFSSENVCFVFESVESDVKGKRNSRARPLSELRFEFAC